MQFEYHPDFVEQAVFLASRLDAERECELHAFVDRLYAIPDAELKDRAFREANAERFTKWRLGAALADAIDEWKAPAGQISRCVVIPASRSSNQYVDLLVKPTTESETQRTLLLQVRPQSLFEPATLRSWLHRELMHVSDMLDEDFGYDPGDLDGAVWECNVQRDRYSVLWRIYVAGRFMREGCCDDREIAALRTAFRRAFTHHGVAPSGVEFDRLLDWERLTHAQLLEWAKQPESLLEDEHPAQVDEVESRLSGEEHVASECQANVGI
jgi:hypothetical protein